MKNTIILTALAAAAFATDMRTQGELTQIDLELARLRTQLQVVQAQQNRPAQTYIAGETADQRRARHVRAVAEAAEAYRADWQAKNPLLPSFRAPAFPKQFADRAIAASDAQAAADSSAPRPQTAPDPRIAIMERRIKALEAQMASKERAAKKRPVTSPPTAAPNQKQPD